MEMHQGQMCKIRRRADGMDVGLYLKLRSSDGKQRYYRVSGDSVADQVDDCRTLALTDVDANVNNRTEERDKPYMITCVVPTEHQVKLLQLNPDTDADAEASRYSIIAGADEATGKIEEELVRLSKSFLDRMDWLEKTYGEINTMLGALAEFEKIKAAAMNDPNAQITYVYGRHEGCDKKYCWRVPMDLSDKVEVGMLAVGDTANGPKEFTISRIERMARFLQHNMLISVEPENDDEEA